MHFLQGREGAQLSAQQLADLQAFLAMPYDEELDEGYSEDSEADGSSEKESDAEGEGDVEAEAHGKGTDQMHADDEIVDEDDDTGDGEEGDEDELDIDRKMLICVRTDLKVGRWLSRYVSRLRRL